MENHFLEVKKQYNALREIESKKIKNYLEEKGYSCKTSKGITNYTNGHQLKKSYDLSNWKWVEATKGNITFFISLQSFDRDKRSHNYHVLFDRIGVCVYPSDMKKPDYFNLMRTTEIELPLGEEELENLCRCYL